MLKAACPDDHLQALGNATKQDAAKALQEALIAGTGAIVEDPVVRPVVGSLEPPVPQLLRRFCVERHRFLRGCRLAGPDLLLDHGAGNVDLQFHEACCAFRVVPGTPAARGGPQLKHALQVDGFHSVGRDHPGAPARTQVPLSRRHQGKLTAEQSTPFPGKALSALSW